MRTRAGLARARSARSAVLSSSADEQIPVAARVFAVVDTLDAMTSDRPYREALGWDDAVEEILAQSGRQFDPGIVELFAAGERDLRAVYQDLRLVA
jgi:HD-GYP domain-containing protein (c-di-GMP phosphodiesterase class II)